MAKAKGPLYISHFRRRRAGLTDYAARLALLKSGKPRMVVRKTNGSVLAQFLLFDAKGDKTVAFCSSQELEGIGFAGKRNTPSAYLVGLRAGLRAKRNGVKEFVFDIGRQTASKGSLLFAALQGALDAGLQSNVGEEIMPSAERISGKHLSAEVQKSFEAVKQKIIQEAGQRKASPSGA